MRFSTSGIIITFLLHEQVFLRICSVLRVTICAKIVLRETLHPNEGHERHKISDLPTADTYNVNLIPCKRKRIRQESKAFNLKAVYSFIDTLLVSDTSSGLMAFLLPLTATAACSIADSISLLLFRQGLECKPEYSSTSLQARQYTVFVTFNSWRIERLCILPH